MTHARILTLLLFFSLTQSWAYAQTVTAEQMVAAQPGESEARACARASHNVREELLDTALADVKDRPAFQRAYDAYLLAGQERDVLLGDLREQLADVDVQELQRIWSGKSCVVQAFADIDADAALRQLESEARARRPVKGDAPPRPASEAAPELAMPGLAPLLRDRSLFSAALAELATFRMLVAEYYLTEGVWPASLGDLGITERDIGGLRYLVSVSIKPGGVITGLLQAPFSGDQIFLRPEATSLNINWHCSTTVSSGVAAVCR